MTTLEWQLCLARGALQSGASGKILNLFLHRWIQMATTTSEARGELRA